VRTPGASRRDRTRRAVVTLALILSVTPSASARQERSAAGADSVARRAEAARLANRPHEAIPLYRAALESDPDWAEGWFHLGTLLYAQDDCGPAANAFERASSLAPGVGTAWVMLGLCQVQLGRHDEALASLVKGRQLGLGADPQLRRVVQYHEGLLLLERDEFERAQETLNSLSAEAVEEEEVIVALGHAVLRVRPSTTDTGDAAQRDLLIRAGRAEHLAARKKLEESRQAYEQLAADFPHLRNVHYAVGRFFASIAQPDKAVAAYERELQRFPDHVPARLGIAAIRAETDPAAALPYAEEAVRINPNIPLGHYLLGSLLLRTGGDLDRAIAALETAERSVRDDPGLYYALGRAYARAGRSGDAARAREVFKRLTDAQQAAARRTPEPR
jgi:tetratricopeptide (TPR) repeat protein